MPHESGILLLQASKILGISEHSEHHHFIGENRDWRLFLMLISSFDLCPRIETKITWLFRTGNSSLVIATFVRF
jgi:hypothetical protein